MGATSSCKVTGAGVASDTEWGWWFFNRATAQTYTYGWRLMADNAVVTGALPAAAKFIAGPPPKGQIWPTNSTPHTGPRGSTATANHSGASSVDGQFWYTYGVDTFATAETTVAPGGGTAEAKSTITDPWEVPVRHLAGLPTVLMVSAQVMPLLAPQPRGSSAFALHGSFGEIRFGLNGAGNTPDCKVTLEPGWQVYVDVPAPPAPGMPILKPPRASTPDEVRQLFLDQHDPASPIWSWRRPAPTLTFVRPVPAGVTTERIEVSLTAEDADEAPVETRQRRRDKGEVLA